MTITQEPPVRDQAIELAKVAGDPLYFARHYIRIKPDKSHVYVPFDPWPAQEEIFDGLDQEKYVVLLKARQLGMTLIVLVYALWVALIEPNSQIFLLSRKKDDAYKLLRKLRMMYLLLPRWLKARFRIVTDNSGTLEFSNGSIFYCYASNKSAADGQTGRLCVIDEADLISDLDLVLNGVMPAIHAAGQLILLSKSNKDLQKSRFKAIYRAATRGDNDFWPKFLPWWARPDRTRDEYDAALRNSGSIDFLWENYPESAAQALAPRQESKRIPLPWLEACSPELDEHGIRKWPEPIATPEVLVGVPGLRLYEEPVPGSAYVIGTDLASGKGENPNLDDSASIIMDVRHCRQVGILVGKVEPGLFAEYTAQLARYYNRAGVLPELNGRWGGQFFQAMKDKHDDVRLLKGPDGNPGFNTTQQTKSELYQKVAEAARVTGFSIADEQTFEQLASIEGATLEAPVGLHDDVAIAFGLALWAADRPQKDFAVEFIELGKSQGSVLVGPEDLVQHNDFDDAYEVKLTAQVITQLRLGKVMTATTVGRYRDEESALRVAAATLEALDRAGDQEPADPALVQQVRQILAKKGF